MHKNVLIRVFGNNESIAFGIVKPFDCTFFHNNDPFRLWNNTIGMPIIKRVAQNQRVPTALALSHIGKYWQNIVIVKLKIYLRSLKGLDF